MFQEDAIAERPQPCPTVRTMRSYHEELRDVNVSPTRYARAITIAYCVLISFPLARTIQDPASQRLTWYKNPLSVLVIKKVRDMSVLPPFIQLVRWLIQVSAVLQHHCLSLFLFTFFHASMVFFCTLGEEHDCIRGTLRNGGHNAH